MSAEERQGVHTVAGFVLARLGHIPRPAKNFEWAGWRFEVVDMDGRRIDTVLVTPLGEGPDGSRERA